MSRQLTAWFRPTFLYLAVLFFLLWTVAPVSWIAVMSVQPEINYVSVPPQLQVLGTEHGLGPLAPMEVAVYRSRASRGSKAVDSLQNLLVQTLRQSGGARVTG